MTSTLFRNARLVLAGARELSPPSEVLVEEGRITQLGVGPLDAGGPQVVEVGGRTMLPGLIDAHTHVTGLSLSPKNIAYPDSEILFAAAAYLKAALLDGFTTVREVGGADHRIAQLLDAGSIVGPRLFYSGRALTSTGVGPTSARRMKATTSVGAGAVLGHVRHRRWGRRGALGAREELRLGATQIKLFASGGVVFPSKAHATRWEFSPGEMVLVVEEAEARGTYVMAHVYTHEGVRRCLDAGVRSIEDANFVSEATVAAMSEHGAFFDPTFISLVQRIESAAEHGLAVSIVHNLEETVRRGAAGVRLGQRAGRARGPGGPTCGVPRRGGASCGSWRCGWTWTSRRRSCARRRW